LDDVGQFGGEGECKSSLLAQQGTVPCLILGAGKLTVKKRYHDFSTGGIRSQSQEVEERGQKLRSCPECKNKSTVTYCIVQILRDVRFWWEPIVSGVSWQRQDNQDLNVVQPLLQKAQGSKIMALDRFC
jgi:hypothetical protein